MSIKGIEITVIKENGEKVIAGYYEPWTLEDGFLTTYGNAVGNEALAALISNELVPLKEKIGRAERRQNDDN